jgi:hypothetical protein
MHKLTALLPLLCATLTAQWLSYPTPGVPKMASGAPDLKAPAPRTAGGKPDLSGIWMAEKNRQCPPFGCTDMEVNEQFVDLGWGLKGGLPYQPWARDLMLARRAVAGQDDPGSHCLPTSVVKLHTTPLYRKIVQTPALIVILNEIGTSYRQIFTDGRPLPADPQPAWNGYSTANWDGDTLVVETNGFRDGTWLDRNGSPLTEAARITERFRRVNFGHMEIEIAVNDPQAYTAPFTVQLNEFIVLDTELLDYVCLENERDDVHLTGK